MVLRRPSPLITLAPFAHNSTLCSISVRAAPAWKNSHCVLGSSIAENWIFPISRGERQ